MHRHPVLLVSLDGIAPRFVTPERMPHLCGLVRSGAGCFTARTVIPPLTRPAHASMLRGVPPDVHGLVDNSMADPTTDVPSVLAVARGAGRSTACVSNWRQIDTLVEPGAATHRIAIDGGYDPAEDDRMVDLVAALTTSHRPDVMFVYLCGTDLAGHDHGWGSDEYLAACTRIDGVFGRLLTAVGDDTSVLVTTDHGGVAHHHMELVDDVLDVFVAVRSARVAPGSMWAEATTLDIAPTVADLAGVDPDPRWVGGSLLGRERPMVDHLLDLLRESDRHTYGEGVTMLEHALQSAAAAAAAVDAGEGDDELVVAALLHDVGHLEGPAGEFGRADHAATGAVLLQPWLPATVTEPIRLHVDAKRHLVGVDAAYRDELSEASRITLAQQGGPFNGEESADFVALVHADRAIRLRRYDDQGKRPGAPVVAVEHHRDRITAALAAGPIDASGARSACRCDTCRDGGVVLVGSGDASEWCTLGSRRRSGGLEVDLAGADGARHTAWLPAGTG